jgi:hypothetical protein
MQSFSMNVPRTVLKRALASPRLILKAGQKPGSQDAGSAKPEKHAIINNERATNSAEKGPGQSSPDVNSGGGSSHSGASDGKSGGGNSGSGKSGASGGKSGGGKADKLGNPDKSSIK